MERRALAESSAFEESRAEVEAVLPSLEELGDARVLAEGWLIAAKTRLWSGRVRSAQEAYERSLNHAERLGDRGVIAEVCGWLSWSFLLGPRPVEEGFRRVASLRERFGDEPVAATWFDQVEAGLEALRGRSEEAAGLLARALARLDDLGMPFVAACCTSEIGYYVGRVPRRPEEMESWVRPGYEALKEMGEKGMLSTRAAFLADAVCAQGRLEEAEALVRESESLGAPDDLMTQIAWRAVEAKVLSRRGKHSEAERLAREAVSLAEPTEWFFDHGRALEDLGDVLDRAGKAEEARAAFARAADLYDRKGMATSAERLRELLQATAG